MRWSDGGENFEHLVLQHSTATDHPFLVVLCPISFHLDSFFPYKMTRKSCKSRIPSLSLSLLLFPHTCLLRMDRWRREKWFWLSDSQSSEMPKNANGPRTKKQMLSPTNNIIKIEIALPNNRIHMEWIILKLLIPDSSSNTHTHTH